MGSVAVSVGRRAGSGVNVWQQREYIQKSGCRRWPSAVAVSGGRRGRRVLVAISLVRGTRKRRKRRWAGRLVVVGRSFLGYSLNCVFVRCVPSWGGGWGRSREAAAAGGRQQPRSGGSSSREAAAGRWLGLGLQAGRVMAFSRLGWAGRKAGRQNGGRGRGARLAGLGWNKKGGLGWLLYTFLFFGGWGLGAGSPETFCPLGGWGAGGFGLCWGMLQNAGGRRRLANALGASGLAQGAEAFFWGGAGAGGGRAR